MLSALQRSGSYSFQITAAIRRLSHAHRTDIIRWHSKNTYFLSGRLWPRVWGHTRWLFDHLGFFDDYLLFINVNSFLSECCSSLSSVDHNWRTTHPAGEIDPAQGLLSTWESDSEVLNCICETRQKASIHLLHIASTLLVLYKPLTKTHPCGGWPLYTPASHRVNPYPWVRGLGRSAPENPFHLVGKVYLQKDNT